MKAESLWRVVRYGDERATRAEDREAKSFFDRMRADSMRRSDRNRVPSRLGSNFLIEGLAVECDESVQVNAGVSLR